MLMQKNDLKNKINNIQVCTYNIIIIVILITLNDFWSDFKQGIMKLEELFRYLNVKYLKKEVLQPDPLLPYFGSIIKLWESVISQLKDEDLPYNCTEMEKVKHYYK